MLTERTPDQSPPQASRVVEIDGVRRSPIYGHLQRGSIVMLRGVPEIREIARALERFVAHSDGAERASSIARLLRGGEIADVETVGAFYRAFRHLRDSRYLSCLLSDLIASFGLPTPILIDSGFCRIVPSTCMDEIGRRPELFPTTQFDGTGSNEAEGMLCSTAWGAAHRDIDVRHNHFQMNLWFPLHDIEANQSLLLFPEAYRRDVPQYGKLEDGDTPDNWGFGRSLQLPMALGDVLVFHSQQLHASPKLRTGQNRFTVEFRAAGGCADDNAGVYRRLFWKIENFSAGTADPSSAPDRAAQLAEPLAQPPSLEQSLAGRTAHAVAYRLFRHAPASLAAAYIHRRVDVLDDALSLDAAAWTKLLARLEFLPCGEDLLLMLVRMAARQQQRNAVESALERIRATTQSYFWALEAGRIAVSSGIDELAAALFERAHELAANSKIVLDRYSQDMPPPRSSRVLQLLPPTATHAAATFAQHMRKRRSGLTYATSVFDWRLFDRPSRLALASFEHYDLVSVGSLVVALPAGHGFRPEQLVASDGVVVGDSIAEITAILGTKLGRALPHPLLVTRYGLRPRSYRLALIEASYVIRPLLSIYRKVRAAAT